MLDPELLKILVCPECKAPVAEKEGGAALVCSKCGRRYPVVDGIANMLVEVKEPGAKP